MQFLLVEQNFINRNTFSTGRDIPKAMVNFAAEEDILYLGNISDNNFVTDKINGFFYST